MGWLRLPIFEIIGTCEGKPYTYSSPRVDVALLDMLRECRPVPKYGRPGPAKTGPAAAVFIIGGRYNVSQITKFCPRILQNSRQPRIFFYIPANPFVLFMLSCVLVLPVIDIV